MDTTFQHLVSCLLLAFVFNQAAVAQTAGSEAFVVSADTPVVETDRQAAGRNFMRLPSLEYRFDLAASCPESFEAKTISLSIADTRTSLATNEISSDGLTSLTMTIPASQIGPVAVDGICVATDSQESIRIPAVLSLQASLLCANDEDSQMTYVSRSLDVTLMCKSAQDESSQ